MAKKFRSLVPKNLKHLLSSKKLTYSFLGMLLMLSLLLSINFIIFADRIYPGIYISGVSVSGLTSSEVNQKINAVLSGRSSKLLTFNYNSAEKSQDFEIDLADTFNLNSSETVAEAQSFGHHKFFIPPAKLNIPINFDENLAQQLDKIATEVDQPPINAQLKVDGDAISVTSAQNGFVLDKDQLKKQLAEYLNSGNLTKNTLPIKQLSPKLSYEGALEIKKRLDLIHDNPIKLKFKDQTFSLDLAIILSFIDLENSDRSLAQGQFLGSQFNLKTISFGNEELTDSRLTLSKEKMDAYFKNLANQINRPVEEPVFSFDGTKVTQFQPPQEGYSLNTQKAAVLLEQALQSENQQVVSLPVDLIKPKNKLVNELGIKELLGRGVSRFYGSIPNRAYNVWLTASRLNGIIIPPGETFSFNGAIGDISSTTGFKQAYVIKSGRTVLDDGGGVCQDSTTLFRAVLYAGLPVLERTAHAYRVGYYEQGYPPGLDATVFSPSVDFKFKNDTLAHILIQSYTYGNTLYVDLYGTSDGRVAQVTTPVVTSVTPAPPPLNQDDPTLPKGEVKQVDFSAAGANVVFSRTVTRENQVLISEKFYSNYRPWQAIFLVGTKE